MAYQRDKDAAENLRRAVDMNGEFDWLDQAYAPGAEMPPTDTLPTPAARPQMTAELEDALGSNYQKVDRLFDWARNLRRKSGNDSGGDTERIFLRSACH